MRAPAWSAPVWDDLAALVEWHEGRCAVCGRSEGLSGLYWFMLQYDHEHLSGEDHRAGRLRGLLCPSCNNRERYGGGELFDAYRRRPPAVILGIDVPYWTWEHGYAYRRASVCWLRGFDPPAPKRGP
jgi:Recombination endonuclease VII